MDTVLVFCQDLAYACLGFFSIIAITLSIAVYFLWHFILKRFWIKFWNSELKPIMQYCWICWTYDLDNFNICLQTVLVPMIIVTTGIAIWAHPSTFSRGISILWLMLSLYAVCWKIITSTNARHLNNAEAPKTSFIQKMKKDEEDPYIFG